MKLKSLSRVMIGLSLVGVAVGGLSALPARAQRPVLKYKFGNIEAHAEWTVPIASDCQDFMVVSLLEGIEVTWDRDAHTRTTSTLGPDVTMSIDRQGTCSQTRLFSIGSDPNPTPSPKYSKLENLQGARVDIDHVVNSDGFTVYDANIHLRWARLGSNVNSQPQCFVMDDPDTNTCLKFTFNERVQPQTLTGDLSGVLTTTLGTGALDSTPGAFSAANPDVIYIREVTGVNSVLETRGSSPTACHCPAPQVTP